MVMIDERTDIEEMIPVPEPQAKRGRKRKDAVTPPEASEPPKRRAAPKTAELVTMFQGLFEVADMGMASWAAGKPEREIWRLQPFEREAEAQAIAKCVAAYPVLQKYLLQATKNAPILELAFLNWTIFAPRMAVYRAMTSGSEIEA